MRWAVSTGLVKPLSLNDRMGWQQKARLTRETRAAVGWHTLALKVGAHLRCAGGLGGRLRTLTSALRRDPEAAGNPARHSFWSSP